MPENVTRFQPIENVKKPLIRCTYIDIMPSRLPTFFHEEPLLVRYMVYIQVNLNTYASVTDMIGKEYSPGLVDLFVLRFHKCI